VNTKVPGEEGLPVSLLYHKSHMGCPGKEIGFRWWEAWLWHACWCVLCWAPGKKDHLR